MAATHATAEWMGIADLAREIGVPVRTIYAWRTKGKGPRGCTFGKHVRFRRADVQLWIEAQFEKDSSAA